MGNYGGAGFWPRPEDEESEQARGNGTYESVSVDRRCPDTGARKASASRGTSQPSTSQLLFHGRAKGRNVTLDVGRKRATRRHSFCHGVTFGHRAVRTNEHVRLSFTGTAPGWSGALRFGFTSNDPTDMEPARIPRYACPDLASRPGYWAKALPEGYATWGTVLEFWVETDGRAFYQAASNEPQIFLRGVDITNPLWVLIDIYGVSQQVTLLETMFVKPSRRLSPFPLCPRLPSPHEPAQDHNSEGPVGDVVASLRETHIESSQATPSALSAQILCTIPDSLAQDLLFHPLHGPLVSLSEDRTQAEGKPTDQPGVDGPGHAVVFSGRPITIGETVYILVRGLSRPGEPLTFGLTSCDPATLSPTDLPNDPHSLVDRREYWVVVSVCPLPAAFQRNNGQVSWRGRGGEVVLGFALMPDGEVHLSVNGTQEGMLVCVDPSQLLWLLFGLQGVKNTLKILGSHKPGSSAATLPPVRCGLPSPDTLADCSESSASHRSSLLSSSSSSLVTAPGSPDDEEQSLLPLPPPTQRSEETVALGNRGECTICFERLADSVIYTCGHMCLCFECGERLRRQIHPACPICRRVIKDIIRTYPI
uniref:RING-type E3 ubiquitin transferase n=1 Tax=Eptatretus burgeri TaxID=7764 RepID=A0A8C4Q4N1_EPTBU